MYSSVLNRVFYKNKTCVMWGTKTRVCGVKLCMFDKGVNQLVCVCFVKRVCVCLLKERRNRES
jgi:hypothetical protein